MAWESIGSEAFISLDADLKIGQARKVIGKMSSRYLVVRVAATGHYFVLKADDVLRAAAEHWGKRTLGSFANLHALPAVVVDTDDGWAIVTSDQLDKNVDAVVVNDDGSVARIVPSLRITVPPRSPAVQANPALDSSGWHYVRAPSRASLGADATAITHLAAIRAEWHEGDDVMVVTSPVVIPRRNQMAMAEPPERDLAAADAPTAAEPPPPPPADHGDGEEPSDNDANAAPAADEGAAPAEGGDGAGSPPPPPLDGGDRDDAGGGGGDEVVSLEVSLPDVVEAGAEVSLFVLLQQGAGGPGSAVFTVHDAEVIEVLVAPSAGFTLHEPQSKMMTVRLGGETLPLSFKLVAGAAGKGVVKVYAFRSGQCVASVTVSARIDAHVDAHAVLQPAGEVTTLRAPPPVKVAVADLDLTIIRVSHNGGIALVYRLADAKGKALSEFGPQPLDSEPGSYVHDMFKEIQDLTAEQGGSTDAKEVRLQKIGTDLYESLIPDDLRKVLWETQRVRSLQIQTDEPWIPWELCRMTFTENGTTSERDFLCEQYEMSRWLPTVPPKQKLTATRIGIIAPLNTGLPSVPLEVEMLTKLKAHGPSVTRIKATYATVVERLGSHAFDVLHFSGHGLNADPDNTSRSEFVLAGKPPLTPSDISGATRNLGLRTPLVFMNACELAQASMALHGIGGWAAAMTSAGAGAFVGTHWDVRDDLALRFSTAFYAELAKKKTIPAAVRTARRTVRKLKNTDATWLAYSVHATPGATCEFGKPT